MFIIKFLRFLRGIVFFRASGGFPERFLNLCSNKNIILKDVQIKDDILFASTDIKSYKRIREPARKSGMKIRITKKSGLPFLCFKYKSRAGLILGSMVFLGILGFLSLFIWTVDVSGSVSLSDEEIIKEVNLAGIKSGVLRDSIEIESIEERLLKKFPELSFAAINLQGSNAEIKIKEKPPVNIKDNDPAPCDIIASKDGQIVTIENFCGTQLLNMNDAVLKGDVILSSVVENMNSTYTFKKAQGYITAKTDLEISSELNAQESFLRVDKITESRELFFFHLNIPLNKSGEKKNAYIENIKLTLNKKRLPVGIEKKRSVTLKKDNRRLNSAQAKIIAFEGFCNKLSDEARYKKVLNSEIYFKENRICTRFSGNFMLLENIGAKKPVILEKN